MKDYDSNIIRNIAVLSHDGAGKTALVESMLLMCKGVDAVGRGKDNKHILDFEPEENHPQRNDPAWHGAMRMERLQAELHRHPRVF